MSAQRTWTKPVANMFQGISDTLEEVSLTAKANALRDQINIAKGNWGRSVFDAYLAGNETVLAEETANTKELIDKLTKEMFDLTAKRKSIKGKFVTVRVPDDLQPEGKVRVQLPSGQLIDLTVKDHNLKPGKEVVVDVSNLPQPAPVELSEVSTSGIAQASLVDPSETSSTATPAVAEPVPADEPNLKSTSL